MAYLAASTPGRAALCCATSFSSGCGFPSGRLSTCSACTSSANLHPPRRRFWCRLFPRCTPFAGSRFCSLWFGAPRFAHDLASFLCNSCYRLTGGCCPTHSQVLGSLKTSLSGIDYDCARLYCHVPSGIDYDCTRLYCHVLSGSENTFLFLVHCNSLFKVQLDLCFPRGSTQRREKVFPCGVHGELTNRESNWTEIWFAAILVG